MKWIKLTNFMKTCQITPGCKNVVEGRTDGCASCNHAVRKAERTTLKEKKPINKVSNKRGKELNQYASLKAKFMLNRWCVYHGKPCLPIDIHHQMGKVGFADDKEIPLLLDVRYWIPVCRVAHDWITEHSKEAIEQGYSFSRISKKEN